MCKIYMKLRDGEHLGYIQIRDGEPYYGYTREEATDMSLEEAKALCNRLSDKYLFTIEVPKKDRLVRRKKIEIVEV